MYVKENNTAVEEAWKLARVGRFTASNIYKLESKGSGEMFGAGAKTYIKEITVDAYTLFEDRNIQSYAMMMGKITEPEAFEFYKKMIGFTGMQYFGGGDPLFQPMGDHAGGSPDAGAIMPDGSWSFGGELKCPNRDTHWDYLTEIKDQFDLYKISPQYYGQCQFLMKVFRVDLWHWVSYNSYFPLKDRGHLIEVKKDSRWQDNMEVRLASGIKKKLELMDVLKNRK